jgi:hypothetical protein
VGCGAGVAIADMLSQVELDVVGFNISPKMVRFAQSRVKGLFTISDMLGYDPDCQFAAVSNFFLLTYLSRLQTSAPLLTSSPAHCSLVGGVYAK